jgi:hypothetical protein
MAHFVAIVEVEEGKAAGVWFPDLPGCVFAGDTVDEAMINAAEARSGRRGQHRPLYGCAHPPLTVATCSLSGPRFLDGPHAPPIRHVAEATQSRNMR